MLKLTMCNIISITARGRFIKSLVGNGSEAHAVLFLTDMILISSAFETKAYLCKPEQLISPCIMDTF